MQIAQMFLTLYQTCKSGAPATRETGAPGQRAAGAEPAGRGRAPSRRARKVAGARRLFSRKRRRNGSGKRGEVSFLKRIG